MEHNKFKRSNTEKGSTSNNIERAPKNETNWETFQTSEGIKMHTMYVIWQNLVHS